MIIIKPDHIPAGSGKATSRTCHDAPSGQMLLAIRQFNSGQWYECHETLEALWLQETGEVRDFYQGLVQLAIALHHWRNGNFNGAIKLLESSANYLKRMDTPCLWVDVSSLIRQAAGVRDELLRLGSEHMATLDQAFIPQITTVSV